MLTKKKINANTACIWSSTFINVQKELNSIQKVKRDMRHSKRKNPQENKPRGTKKQAKKKNSAVEAGQEKACIMHYFT